MTENMWIQFVLPVLTAVIAWLGSAYRNKQKKEHDVLDNVQRIIDLQNAHIMKSEAALEKSDRQNQRLDAKLDRKNKSIRKANNCRYTNEGDGCPVLNQEETNERIYDEGCRLCEHHSQDTSDDND